MFVSIFATGITDYDDDGIALNCKIDGANCVPGVGTAGTGSVADIPAGWVIALGDEFGGYGDLSDTGLSFVLRTPRLRRTDQRLGRSFSTLAGFCDHANKVVERGRIRSSDTPRSA